MTGFHPPHGPFAPVLRTILGLSFLLPAQASPAPVGELTDRVEFLVPGLLATTEVPGAAVVVVHDGRLVYSAGFGWADPEAHTPVTEDTVFNVGSISKPVTAWGVMAAAKQGVLELDQPVGGWLGDLPQFAEAPGNAVTVRQLLAHTSGLSTPSVPEYLPWETLPRPVAWLSSPESEVRLDSAPGTSWAYSGAGYTVLQVLLERRVGGAFADLMARAVLKPLGMRTAGFHDPSAGAPLARPHDRGQPIPRRRYPEQAAAGLFASANDLAAFLLSHADGAGVLSSDRVAQMLSGDPLSQSPYGTRYGLGYSVWPLPDGRWSVGHRGQNHGWSAVFWLSPERRDGLAVLTNDSEGEALYRPVLCAWAEWLTGQASFGRYCSVLEPPTPSTLGERDDLRESWRERIPEAGPGAAVLVARGEEVLLRESRGFADLDSGEPLTPSTPFYLASLAKPITAAIVLDLVRDGRLALDDRVDRWLPDLARHWPVTVRQLLLHTDGLPDVWEALRWDRPLPASNTAVLQMLADESDPGLNGLGEFEYGNSGYLLLATLAERVTGVRFADLLQRQWPGVPASSRLQVLDRPDIDLPQRARGFRCAEGACYRSDYRRLEVPGKPARNPDLAWVGAGGIVANLDGLHGWILSLLSGDLISPEIMPLALAPGPTVTGLDGIGADTAATLSGWFSSESGGHRVLWADGALFGHRTVMVVEPDSGLLAVILANRDDLDLRTIATDLLEQAR